MKIGFVTDLHYREAVPGDAPNPKRESRRVGTLLLRCLQHLQDAGAELVLVAGDNVDSPLDDPRLNADLVSLRDMLSASGIPFVIIPGNHDPDPEAFYRVLPMPPRAFRLGDCEIITFCDDMFDRQMKCASRQTGVLNEMRGLLSSVPSSIRHTILLQHYVLHPEQEHHGSDYRYNYLNDGEIRTILEASPRKILSLSGHLHRGHPLVTHNGVSYLVGRALCEHPFPYHMLHTRAEKIDIQEFHGI